MWVVMYESKEFEKDVDPANGEMVIYVTVATCLS